METTTNKLSKERTAIRKAFLIIKNINHPDVDEAIKKLGDAWRSKTYTN